MTSGHFWARAFFAIHCSSAPIIYGLTITPEAEQEPVFADSAIAKPIRVSCKNSLCRSVRLLLRRRKRRRNKMRAASQCRAEQCRFPSDSQTNHSFISKEGAVWVLSRGNSSESTFQVALKPAACTSNCK